VVTPEGEVKAKVRKLLASYEQGMFTYWPVPSGYGRTTLDVLGCYRGQFFAVETKADGKKPTLRQTEALKDIGNAMGKTFVLVGVDDPRFNDLVEWLDGVTGLVPHAPQVQEDTVKRKPI
jgi:hypothetical protein